MKLLLKNWNFWWPRAFFHMAASSLCESVHRTDLHLQFSTVPLFLIVLLTTKWRTAFSLTSASINILCVSLSQRESQLETCGLVVSFLTSSNGLVHLTDNLIQFPKLTLIFYCLFVCFFFSFISHVIPLP